MKSDWTRSSAKSHSRFPAGSYVATGRWGTYVIDKFGGSAFQVRLQIDKKREGMKWFVIYSGLSSLKAAKDIAEDYDRKATTEPTREAWLEDGRNPRPLEGTNMASHVGLEVPSVEEVVKELKAIKREMAKGDVDEEGLEIRLQVLSNGKWVVHYGDPGFDTDHHGFWGAGSLGGEETVEELEQIAKDLISEVEESAAQSDEGDEDDEGEDFNGEDDDEPSKQERAEFKSFCRNASDRQLPNIVQKERDAGRTIYAEIAEAEMERRGLEA